MDSSKIRVTEYGYDWRGRRSHTFLEEDAEGNATHAVSTYDNMGRVIKSERFLSVQGTSPLSSGSYSPGTSFGGTQPSVADGLLLARTELFYDERSRNWKTVQSVVNPTTGNVSGKMQSLTWFDAASRVIKSQGMGENHFTKNVYDSLNRIVKNYVSTNPADLTYAILRR